MLRGDSRLYGILGFPLAHSLSPLLHNTGFRFSKVNAVYVPFPVKNPSLSTKEALLELGVQGLSVTIPHKAWAAEIADEKDSLSEHCEAANTLILREGKCHAYNTDGPGALEALEENIKELKGKSFLLIGYGGSANAIAHSLLLKGLPRLLFITGHNPEKRKAFEKRLQDKYPSYASLIQSLDSKDLPPDEVDVIIHTTPLGMQGGAQEPLLPIEGNFIQKSHWVFDIVYTPRRTPLLEHAGSKGARIIEGYRMLLYQACLQFELFCEKKAPRAEMERVLLDALKRS